MANDREPAILAWMCFDRRPKQSGIRWPGGLVGVAPSVLALVLAAIAGTPFVIRGAVGARASGHRAAHWPKENLDYSDDQTRWCAWQTRTGCTPPR